MEEPKYNLTPFAVTFLLCIIGLVLVPLSVYASDNPNTITFDNRSGECTLVKLMGPTEQMVEVLNDQSRTVNVTAGEYYLLVRYGSKPGTYKYTKGDPFTVTQTPTEYSVITITLHAVVGGNYPSHPISSEEFDNAAVVRQNVDRLEGIKALNPVLPPPAINLPPPAIHLPPPTIHLPPPAIQLPSPAIQLPPPTVNIPPPAVNLPPPVIHLPPPPIQLPSLEETTSSVTRPETLDSEASNMQNTDVIKSPHAAQAKEPFTIRDKRLLQLSSRDPCHTDAEMIEISSQGFLFKGLVEVFGGEIQLWCNGAKHTWIGRHENIQGAIAVIDSDKEDPLQFKIDKEKGYVYQKGKGTVTLPEGKVVILPTIVEVGSKASVSPPISTAPSLAGEWTGNANWQGILFTITFSVAENMREVRNLKVVFECARGVGKIGAASVEPMMNLEGNKFNFVIGEGQFRSTGTAAFDSEEHGEGSFNAPFSMKCGDDVLGISGRWSAQKEKN